MIGRMFWFALGVGATVYVVVKVRSYVNKHSPEALATAVQQSVVDAAHAAQATVARVRAASAERETELRNELGLTK